MGPPSLLEPALNTSLFIYFFSLFWGCHRPSRQDAGILQSSGTLPEQRSRGVCRGRGAHPLALLSQCLLHQAGAGGAGGRCGAVGKSGSPRHGAPRALLIGRGGERVAKLLGLSPWGGWHLGAGWVLLRAREAPARSCTWKESRMG